MQHLSFWVWFILLSIIVSAFIHLLANFMIEFFCISIVFQCVYAFHFHYLVIRWWTFSLFPCPSYREESSSEPGWARTCRVRYGVFGHTPSSHIAGSHARSTFSFLRILHLDFHRGWTSFQCCQQRLRFLLSPHLRQRLLSVVLDEISQSS